MCGQGMSGLSVRIFSEKNALLLENQISISTGLCLVQGDLGVEMNENVIESEDLHNNICKGTCILGSSEKTHRTCVNVGGERVEFGEQSVRDLPGGSE